MAKAAADAKGPEAIPSNDDDKPVEEVTLTRMAKPHKVGRTTPVDKTTSVGKTASGKAAKLRIRVASNAARDVAMGETPTGASLMMDDGDKYVNNKRAAGMARPRLMAVTMVRATALVNDSIIGGQVGASVCHDRASEDPGGIGSAVQARDEPNDLAPALPNGQTHQVPSTVAGGLAPTGKHRTSAGDSVATEGDEEDNYDNIPTQIPHGMADLRAAMAVEGMTAFRFAESIDAFDGDDNWANEYGAFVANLHDKATALAMALSLAARLQAYLALLPNADTFVVLHGLHRWVTVPPSRSVNEGKLVAFKGETLREDSREPLDLLRFDGEENDLFKLLSLAKVDLAQVTKFYDGSFPHRNHKWFD
jgi:hypothetical protein